MNKVGDCTGISISLNTEIAAFTQPLPLAETLFLTKDFYFTAAFSKLSLFHHNVHIEIGWLATSPMPTRIGKFALHFFDLDQLNNYNYYCLDLKLK